jgi:hypothetical protein
MAPFLIYPYLTALNAGDGCRLVATIQTGHAQGRMGWRGSWTMKARYKTKFPAWQIMFIAMCSIRTALEVTQWHCGEKQYNQQPTVGEIGG